MKDYMAVMMAALLASKMVDETVALWVLAMVMTKPAALVVMLVMGKVGLWVEWLGSTVVMMAVRQVVEKGIKTVEVKV